MVFFFDETEIGTRFSLLVGAMFAAVANKYIVDSFLPMSVGFTLVDGIHVITFVYILLSGCISVFVMHHQRKTGAQHDRGGGWWRDASIDMHSSCSSSHISRSMHSI